MHCSGGDVNDVDEHDDDGDDDDGDRGERIIRYSNSIRIVETE